MSESTSSAALTRRIARLLRETLERGGSVEIDGVGTLSRGGKDGIRFVPQTKPRVFIAYVEEDLALARKLYRAFEDNGFRPWLDKKKLMPGQNWPRAIESAIESSDFFVACFSRNSVDKKGGFQSEVRYGLDCERRMPLDEIYLAPVRLDDCRMPRSIQRHLQYIDLFPDWQRGFRRLVHMMRRGPGWRSRWRQDGRKEDATRNE